VKGAALQFPTWAPDGKSIYVSYRNQGGTEAHVDRVDLATGVRTQVVADAGYPTISRDGRTLAYATSPVKRGGTGLWWSGPDGEDPHQILGPNVFPSFFGLRLAPDGQRLLFAAIGAGNNYVPPGARLPTGLALLDSLLQPAIAYADGDSYDLWTIDLDGRNLHRVTTLAEDLPIATWDPSGGEQIAFLGGGSASTAEAGLAVLNVDGTNLRRLTRIPGHRGLDWTAGP
jgi:Tol biopolymer transport system component